ncbi:hypothetical protein EDD11_005553 [Mortierella claussenii]|nr:hypothetical protein EDD11_005553 [Mortierella claussenii]
MDPYRPPYPSYPGQPLPQHQQQQNHTGSPYGPPPPHLQSGALPPPGSAPMGPGQPAGYPNPGPSPSASSMYKTQRPPLPGVPASAFLIGGALPDKMNTLFIGSIAPGINNMTMEALLKTTGNLIKWKRVQDPTSQQWKPFGFAEYGDAESMLRTLRVLGQDGQQPLGAKPEGLTLTAMDGSGTVKALLVKADEKTRLFLDHYEESRPRTIHDTERDKVALTNANRVIQQMKDGTLETAQSDHTSEEKHAESATTEGPTPSHKSGGEDGQESTKADISKEQQELLDRELNFFRERAAIKEKERKEEEEKAERQRASQHRHQQRDKDSASSSTTSSHRMAGRERAWGSNSHSSTRLTDFVPASGSNHIDVGSGVSKSPTGAAAAGGGVNSTHSQDVGVDSEDEERTRQERREQELEQSYRERERRWEQREVERMRLYEKDKAREQDYIAELQAAKTAMTARFAQWNDDVERERRHEDYYRDRQAFLQKEERYDALDREEEKEELERETAKKAQEVEEAAAATPAIASASIDHEGDSDMKDVSGLSAAGQDELTTASILTIPDVTMLPSLPTKLKLSLATTTGALKRGSDNNSSGVSTPNSSGFVAANEFEQDEDDSKEIKKRRVLVPLKYGDDEEDAAIKTRNGVDSSDMTAVEKENKMQELKVLMQSIPSDAEGLWKWPVQWQFVLQDKGAMLTDRIKPFASKKVVELLGEKEDALTDFVIEHIRQKKPPQDLVNELRNALDDDADVLVMKIWRMLIFETESKARQL